MSEQPTTAAPPPPPKKDPRLGELISGRYKVIAPLGTGGVAKVYRALQLPLNRQVALKVVRPDLEDDQRETFEARFLREAAQAGRLSHPNVVTVYDFGRAEDGSCFIAMELLEGYTMRRLLKGEPLEPERAVTLAIGVARGLRHAHKRGLVHRDVKPSNIFIVIDDEGNEVPRLLDFGLVKGDDTATITRSGAFMGTPHYIAPEQARGLSTVDARADLYSLGCILYRMLTGVLPYEAENPMIIALRHVRDPYPPMAQRRPDVAVDPNLEAIVRRCMEKDPERRYASAGALARELEAWLGEDQLLAAPTVSDLSITEGPPSTLTSRPKPRRWLVPLVVFTSLASGAGLGGYMLSQEKDPEPVTLVGDPVATPVDVEVEAEDGVVEASVEEGSAVEEEGSPSESPSSSSSESSSPSKSPSPSKSSSSSNSSSNSSSYSDSPSSSSSPSASNSTTSKPPPVEEAPPKKDPPPQVTQAPAPTGSSVTVDGVSFDAAHAKRALDFVNSASKEDLLKAGVYSRGVNIILETRPFGSLQDFGDTSYIGEKSVVAVQTWTR